MTFNKAVKSYTEACRLALITPSTFKKADCRELSGGGWKLNIRDQYLHLMTVGLVFGNGEVLVGNPLKAYFARKEREAIDARIWQEKTLPEIKARNGVVDKPLPELPKPQPINMQQARPPRKPRNPFERH